MELFLLLLRLFLAGILALAGIGKLMDVEGGKTAMAEFGIPLKLAKPASIGLSMLEIVLAAAMLSTATSWAASIAAFVLMLIFIGGMLWQIRKGRSPQCHCFGQLHTEPVSTKSVVRNVVFAVPALILSFSGPTGQGFDLSDSAINSVQSVFGVVALAMFAAVILYLRSISRRQAEILKRVALLELLVTDGAAVKRDKAGAPQDSMPIGALFPDFALPDLSGNVKTLNDVLKGRPVIFLFVDAGCIPCGVLLPEVDEWQSELSGSVDFVFVSSGTASDNEHKFGTTRTLILQKNKELSEKVFAKWTPSAILVNSEGRVASHLATGDSAIRKLVEGVRQMNFQDRLSHIPLMNGDSGIPRKIGEPLPDFSLLDIKGNTISKSNLMERRTLVTFWSPNCPHCRVLMDEIRDVDEAGLPNDVNLVIFSDAQAEELGDIDLRSPIVLDKGYKVSIALGVAGTPSAVLVDEAGRFVSETAIGGPNIWSLIRRDKVS